MSRGDKAFIHNAGSKRTTNFGDDLIAQIQTHLNKFGFLFLQDGTLENDKFSTRNKIRKPDLYMETYKRNQVDLVIELDGNGSGKNVHGPDLQSRTPRTKARNQDYNRAGINYIVIHPEELQAYGLNIKKNYEVYDMIVYMVSEKLTQIMDREE